MFEVKYVCGKARSGILTTAHGEVETPFFMPVATKASVKSIESPKLEEIGFQSVISNSFILSLNPSIKTIQNLGGIHKFMNFKKTIFTDSGGFQVLSKDFLVKKSDEGAIFKDPLNGKKDLFTPEKSMDVQINIGSDVAMTLDDVPHYDLNGKDYVDSIKRTHTWAKRCLEEHKRLKEEHGSKQLLFGITQGGITREYRTFSTNKITNMDFDGIALGGMVVGETRKELMKTIHTSLSDIPENKVRYIMGLGSPPDLVRAIGAGIDCFDSTYPTSNARHGSLITDHGRIKIMTKKFAEDEGPIMEGCKCETCKNYSRAYVHYQLKVHELLGYRLATIHNIHYMNNLMKRCRQAIKEENYEEFEEEYLKNYFSGTEKPEFSNNIQTKYQEKDKEQRPVLYLEHKN